MKRTKSYLIISLFLVTTSLYAQRIKGSDTVLPVSQQAAENFMKKYPKAHVTVTGGGSGVGISSLMDNTTDIAMLSRPVKFSEKMKLKEAKQKYSRSYYRLRCSCCYHSSRQSGK